MKKYINTEGIKQYFINNIPEGWREMTPEEIEADELLESQKEYIKAELLVIYNAQDEYLKLQYEPVKLGFEHLLNTGQSDKIMLILTSVYLPDNVQAITQTIYDRYIELTT